MVVAVHDFDLHLLAHLPSQTMRSSFAHALVCAAALYSAAASGPVVNTTYGPVRGATEGGVDVFHSIPFAAPPVKDLRFKAPQPPASWTDVKDVSGMPEICP